jgi:hypothetical protein
MIKREQNRFDPSKGLTTVAQVFKFSSYPSHAEQTVWQRPLKGCGGKNGHDIISTQMEGIKEQKHATPCRLGSIYMLWETTMELESFKFTEN